MTEPTLLIVLYSKYSPQCQRILNVYNSSLTEKIKMVSIDNREYRKLVSTKLNVKTVPCVLMVFDDKKIEKFEGLEVSDWIINTIAKLSPQTNQHTTLIDDATPTPPPSSAKEEAPVHNSTPTPTLVKTHTPIDELDDDEPVQLDPRGGQTQFADMLPSAPPRGVKQTESSKTKSINEIAAEMAAERDERPPPRT